MKKALIILCVFTILSCSKEDTQVESVSLITRAAGSGQYAVMDNNNSLWIGNILKKNSVINRAYAPLLYSKVPVTLSTSMFGTLSQTISNITLTKNRIYINEQRSRGVFPSNAFNYEVGLFSSYDELESLFGGRDYDVCSRFNVTPGYRIRHRSGVYIKFYQESFKVSMNNPLGQIASIPANLIDQAVYVNSTTWGTMGVITLETDYEPAYALQMTERIIQKRLSKAALSAEENRFASNSDCRMNIYGGSSTYTDWTKWMEKRTFSKDHTGIPIFCTFKNVKDNTPFVVN